MAAQNASLGTSANPSKDRPTRRGRDVREDAQNDDSTATANNPPNHGNATNPGEPATFLEWLDPDTPLETETLQEKWDYWYPRSVSEYRTPKKDRAATWDSLKERWWEDDTEQSDIEEWSE